MVQGRHAAAPAPPRRGGPGRAALAAVLSAVLPGAGQLSAGRVRRAVPYLAFSAVLLAIPVAVAALGRDGALEVVVDPGWLSLAVVVIAVSAAVRLVAAYDAYAAVRPVLAGPMAAVVSGVVVLGLVAAAVVVPHLAVAGVALAQRDLVTEVFQAAAPAPVEPDIVEPGIVARSSSASAPALPSPTAVPGAPPAATAAPPSPTWGKDGRYTVLLLGSDAGPGRFSARTDTMVLLTIDPADGSALMIGVPRNLVRIPFVRGPMNDRFPNGFTDIANAVYRYGLEHPELFPGAVDPGATAVEHALAAATGLEIDSWAMVDLAGVVGVAAALGGVTLNVPKALRDRLSPYLPGGPLVSASIPAGRQHLTPDDVYVYVRSRHADSDYSRMARQRCVLEAIGTELTGPRLLQVYPDVARELRRSVTTDIARSSLPELVRLGSELRLARVSTLLLVPPLVNTSAPDYRRIRAVVKDALRGRLPAGSVASARVGAACS